MIKALTAIALIAASFALSALGLLFLDLRKAAVELQQTAVATTSLVQETHARVVGTSENLNAILIQAGLAADEVRRASTEQRRYWDEAGKQTVSLLGDARNAVNELETTEADVDRAAGRISDSTITALAEVPPTLQASQRTLDASTKTVQDAGRILESPTIPATQAHIESISNSLDIWVKRITKPASAIKSAIWHILGIGGPIAAAAAK